MKPRILMSGICTIMISGTVLAQGTYTCRSVIRCRVNSQGTQGCDVNFDYRDCNGATVHANPVCTNGVAGQSGCLCSCLDSPKGWSVSYSLPDGSNVSETRRCVGCVNPNPTPCPTPNKAPPDGRTDCYWIKSICDYACGPNLADITQEECQDVGLYWNFTASTCSTPPANETGCTGIGWTWAPNTETCVKCSSQYCPLNYRKDDNCECTIYTGDNSPVLVDVAGDGFALTGATGGVNFDIDGDGAAQRLGWTSRGSDDAWLVLDLNGDGAIDSGAELFGNFTPQAEPPAGEERNGFRALAEYDQPQNGGNSDGVLDSRDQVFSSLRLWQDIDHDAVSGPGELHTLPSLDVICIHLDYRESKRTDAYGNRFRYRAKVDDAKGAQVNRWAWDVFLVSGQ